MSRIRITITLKNELLKCVDALVDGTDIKNRSHAIESILAKEFASQRIRKAVILAGGRGVTVPNRKEKVSRSLVDYEDKPFIESILAWLKAEGLEEAIVSAGDFAAGIKMRIGDGGKAGLAVSYLPKDEGTASVLKLLMNSMDETFLMVNGDVLSNMDLEEMFDFHKRCKAVCTVGMISAQQPASFGNIVLRGNRIVDFIEKPRAGEEESYLVNAGIYIMEPEIFNLVSPRFASLEKDLFPAMAKAGKLCGYYIHDKWFRLDGVDHR